MFQPTVEEKAEVVANCYHLEKLKFSKALPLVFTEHGAIMAASVLNSPKAVEVSIFVVRAFVQLRETITGQKELARKIAKLERKLKWGSSPLLTYLNENSIKRHYVSTTSNRIQVHGTIA
jgi:hypothetical protein